MHQPETSQNCPVCRQKVDINNPALANSGSSDVSFSKTKKYTARLATLNYQIYQHYQEFIRVLDKQLKDPEVSRQQLKDAGPLLVLDPFSESLPFKQPTKEDLEDIFNRSINQTCGGVSSLGGVPIESPKDVLAAKRTELLALLLKVQRLKRKIGISKPTTKVLQIIKWQVPS